VKRRARRFKLAGQGTLEKDLLPAHSAGMVMDNFPLWALLTLGIFGGSIRAAMWLDSVNRKQQQRRQTRQ
jgi:hypothetical protein